ncbi:MAG: hypothetical protein ACD_43C00168G0001 [uncultured bacterium]|nr:MAG: hypothetical protein ACD_43C00168G0001 [uncultured bacterium]
MFLIWWYTQGLYTILQRMRRRTNGLVRALHLKKLIHYLFVPMYGYADIWSRLISFPVRLVQLTLLLIYAFFYVVIEVIIVLLWFLFPLVVIINIVYQVSALC